MAGRIQKPYDQLQNKRGNRRRTPIYLPPVRYVAEEPGEERSPRARALDVAADTIARQFGRGMIPRATPPESRPQPARKRRPRGEGPVSAAKAKIARERPRDAHGHFLPLPGSRRARLGAASPAAVPVPEALVGVTGTEADVLAALVPPPRRARRPNLLEIADELGDEELDTVIAALVALREGRRREAEVGA